MSFAFIQSLVLTTLGAVLVGHGLFTWAAGRTARGRSLGTVLTGAGTAGSGVLLHADGRSALLLPAQIGFLILLVLGILVLTRALAKPTR